MTTTLSGSANLICFMALFSASLHAEKASACSSFIEDTTAIVTEAPRGGLWWFRGCFTDQEVHPLESLDDGSTVDFPVAFIGLRDFCALQVPDDLSGTSFAGTNFDGSPIEFRVVDAELQDIASDVPSPALRIVFRETLVGNQDVLSSPFGDICSEAPGLWNHYYSQEPWLVGVVPPGFALDLTLRSPTEAAFSEFWSANPILLTGQRSGDIELRIVEPVDGDGRYTVHSRFTRLSDATIGPTQSIPLVLPPRVLIERMEWVGCSAGDVPSETPPLVFFLSLALLLLIGETRRRKDRAHCLTRG